MNSQPVNNNIISDILDGTKNKKRKQKKKTIKKSLSLDNNSSLLSELKSINIPSQFEEKEKLMLTLKSTIVSIDNAIQLLVKKKDYYKEITQKIEKEIEEIKSIKAQQALHEDKIGAVQEELYSMFYD